MPLPQQALEAIARLYGVTAAQLQPATGGHFAYVYELRLNQRACILKIIPPNTDVDVRAMRAVLEWLAFLAEAGGPVVPPVFSQQGNLIEAMADGEQVYIAVVFEKAPGMLAEGMAPEAWSDMLFEALGRTVGACHRIAQDYNPSKAEFRRPEWSAGSSCFNPHEELEDADPILLERRAQTLERIAVLPKERVSYGLAHLDLHFGNFFVDAEAQRIVLFDFDDCAYGWYLMDITMLLFDILVVYNGHEPLSFGAHFLEQFLRGYRSQMPLDFFWVNQLPHFLKLLEIGVYAMLYRDYNPATADEWVSKFMPGRRERIEQALPYVDLDFMAIYQASGRSS